MTLSSLASRLGTASPVALVAVALLQTALLVWMVHGRITLLREGREVVIEVTPVDPRDLFRGDYVIFGYGFNRSGNVVMPGGLKPGDRAYATLKPTSDNQWEIIRVERTYPATVELEHVVLRGVVDNIWPLTGSEQSTGRLRFGIEHYFVPEGQGRDLEKLVQMSRLAVVIAVGRTGEAAIKALVIDGVRAVEEPPL